MPYILTLKLVTSRRWPVVRFETNRYIPCAVTHLFPVRRNKLYSRDGDLKQWNRCTKWITGKRNFEYFNFLLFAFWRFINVKLFHQGIFCYPRSAERKSDRVWNNSAPRRSTRALHVATRWPIGIFALYPITTCELLPAGFLKSIRKWGEMMEGS